MRVRVPPPVPFYMNDFNQIDFNFDNCMARIAHPLLVLLRIYHHENDKLKKEKILTVIQQFESETVKFVNPKRESFN
jgi:hypothetical protein